MKTTWEKLKKQSLKDKIEQRVRYQISLKEDFKSIKQDLKKDPTCSILRNSLNSIHNDIMDNKSEISYYHSELNKINNKEDSHIITKDKKIFFENSTNAFEYKTHILCFDIDSFEIYETIHITETGFKAIGLAEITDHFKFEDIIKEGSKEELIIELSKIQNEVNNISEYKEWQDKYIEYKKRSDKQDKKRKAFDKKMKALKEKFEESLKEETKSLYDMKEEMHKLTIQIRRKKEILYKGLKNDNN